MYDVQNYNSARTYIILPIPAVPSKCEIEDYTVHELYLHNIYIFGTCYAVKVLNYYDNDNNFMDIQTISAIFFRPFVDVDTPLRRPSTFRESPLSLSSPRNPHARPFHLSSDGPSRVIGRLPRNRYSTRSMIYLPIRVRAIIIHITAIASI
jgi:hypothetical protein